MTADNDMITMVVIIIIFIIFLIIIIVRPAACVLGLESCKLWEDNG